MKSKRQYRELFENAIDLLYTHDLEGNFKAISKAVERISGVSRSEVLRMSIYDLLDQESRDRVREAVREVLGGSPRGAFEVSLVARDGVKVPLEVSCRLVFRGGRPVAVQGIARDITERKRAEALERDRNRVLEMVAGQEALETVLGQVCGLLERQMPETRYAILLAGAGGVTVGAAPRLPAAFGAAFRGPTASGEAAAWSAIVERGVAAPVDLAAEPGLAGHRALLLKAGMEGCWVIPLLSADASTVGAFLCFQRERAVSVPAPPAALEAAQRLAVVAIENRRLTERLAHQARHDTLTGLPNRRVFEERLADELENARRHSRLLAVFFIDLDRFKQINDTLGHATGDAVLRQVAERFAGTMRKGDCLARLGGDEFGLVLSGLSDTHDALRVGGKLLDSLSAPFAIGAREIFLTASIGISLYPRDGREAAALQSNADAAMYRAKSRGRGHVEFYTAGIGLAAIERMEMEAALRRALEHGELELYYQPQTDARHGLEAVEALLVWNHPRLGSIPAQQFVSVAEESGMIAPIGDWALGEACLRNAAWQRAGLPRVKVAVNVSPVQFARPDFVENVVEALSGSGLDPSLLELELTENVVMKEPDEAVRQMQRLRALGVGVALDDFGTGYSSLSYLRILPIDGLKLDRSFLKELEREPNTVPLVSAIVALAHGLGLTIVAEGVETRQQFEILRGIGCDRFQGYLLGEAAPAAAIERLLKAAGSMLR